MIVALFDRVRDLVGTRAADTTHPAADAFAAFALACDAERHAAAAAFRNWLAQCETGTACAA